MADEAKIVSILGGQIIPPGEPRPEIITLCEQLLERAKSGNLMGLSVVMYHDDDTHSNQHVGRRVYATIGALEILKNRLVADF